MNQEGAALESLIRIAASFDYEAGNILRGAERRQAAGAAAARHVRGMAAAGQRAAGAVAPAGPAGRLDRHAEVADGAHRPARDRQRAGNPRFVRAGAQADAGDPAEGDRPAPGEKAAEAPGAVERRGRPAARADRRRQRQTLDSADPPHRRADGARSQDRRSASASSRATTYRRRRRRGGSPGHALQALSRAYGAGRRPQGRRCPGWRCGG